MRDIDDMVEALFKTLVTLVIIGVASPILIVFTLICYIGWNLVF